MSKQHDWVTRSVQMGLAQVRTGFSEMIRTCYCQLLPQVQQFKLTVGVPWFIDGVSVKCSCCAMRLRVKCPGFDDGPTVGV